MCYFSYSLPCSLHNILFYIYLPNFLFYFRNFDRAVSLLDKLLLTLRFLATGDFYITMGDFSGIHKTTAGRIIKKGIIGLCNLFPQSIHMPRTEEEQQAAKRDFFNLSNFPRVIGAIDCTHVKIISPGGDNAEIYRNRKGFFSLNCQVVCSAKLKIIDLVSRWPGSTNDSHIFGNSAVKMRFQNGEMGNGVLLGDRGYALRPALTLFFLSMSLDIASLKTSPFGSTIFKQNPTSARKINL